MKVKYATQTLSHTVAAAISMYVSVGAMPASAEFISKFHLIFDCLNSLSLKCPNLYRQALSENSVHQQFGATEAIPFIKSQGDKLSKRN